MARKPAPPVEAHKLQGFKYFKKLLPLLARLHEVGTSRDSAKRRELFFEQFAALILFYFFNPTLTSLRGIQQASSLALVQKKLGVKKTALGSLSEASTLFEANALRSLLAELAAEVPPPTSVAERNALASLTAVDGSLLRALPKMAWALWMDEQNRAAKLHLAFEVLRGVPVAASVTPANQPERDQLRKLLQPGRLYVLDRGYVEYQLFQELLDRGSSFIVRLYSNTSFRVEQERKVTAEGREAGVVRDAVVWLGGPQSGQALKQPLRLVVVEARRKSKHQESEQLLLATDRMDLSAELVALGYRYRWSVELYFRWFKCVLGCRHLLSQSANGVELQVYLALIASLLIQLWAGRVPTKRTYEMLCFYLAGWATEDEVLAHLKTCKEAPP